jgi:hypothetical protein
MVNFKLQEQNFSILSLYFLQLSCGGSADIGLGVVCSSFEKILCFKKNFFFFLVRFLLRRRIVEFIV